MKSTQKSDALLMKTYVHSANQCIFAKIFTLYFEHVYQLTILVDFFPIMNSMILLSLTSLDNFLGILIIYTHYLDISQ